MKNLTLFSFLLCCFGAFAQPVNDDCTTATGLGTMPAPGPCVAGLQDGAPVTLAAQSTVGATGANPYNYITNCSGGGDMTAPALDTWYTLIASGTVLNVNITGFPNASIGVWQGSCANLTPSGCMNVGPGGNGTLVISQTSPGDVFYIQVSGGTATATDNNFTISVDSDIDCDDCLVSSNFTATPLPTNGAYSTGQTVTFCYEITEWDQQNTNWLHGVQLTFGVGWDGTVTNVVPAASCDGVGTWDYYPGGTTSTATATNWGPGFYYDNDGDGNPGNNFGDNCQGAGLSWMFCFDLTVSALCTPGADLSVTMNTTGDGESGSWSSIACADDDASLLPAYLVCCDPPLTTIVDETCPGDGDGSATVLGQGGTAPYDYVWEDGLGAVIYTDNNNAGISALGSLGAGTYTITVTDDNGCVQVVDIVIGAGICSSCPEYAAVAIGAPDACGGQLYDFSVANTGCNGTIIFNVVGNYGSTYGNEITWVVTSVLTGNVVASGGPGTNGTGFNVPVSLDPAIEGTIYEVEIFDSWGDGFNGVGGFIQIEDQFGNVIGGPINGNFGAAASEIFAVNIDISTSTITINTPSGVVTNTIGNCADHDVQLTLTNNFYCTPLNINLPWTIVCDQTGQTISSGTHPVTVYPQIASQASDVVDITWNVGTCQWDVSPQNDCDLLDIGTVFTISPDPAAWPSNTCTGGSQDFTVDYIGVAGGPDCCATGGALVPITYDVTTTVADPIAVDSPYGGQLNAANTTIPASTVGGTATSFDLTVTGAGYCYPDPAGISVDDDWYVAIWVDGVQVLLNGPMTGTTFNITIDETDLAAAGVTYNQNSVIEIYVLPNLFWEGTPPIYTNYIPGGNCGAMGDGQWTMGTYDVTTNVTFTDQTAGPAICSFTDPSPYTCCVVTMPTASDPASINIECSGGAPAPDPLVVTDEASPCNPVVTFLNDVSDGLACPETITRTYRITDDCGNFTDVQQLIIIGDVTPPVFNAPPANVTVDCIGDVPAITNLAYTDNCDPAGTVAGSDGPLIGGNCGGTITRTWTIADGCGNSDTETQIITVNDMQAPVMNAPPAAVAVQCVGDAPAMTNLGYTDNCEAPGTVAGVDVSDGLSCPETITRTWTYTDACGNASAPVTQIITIHDNIAPIITAPLAAANVSCSANVPAMNDLGYTDNCDASGTITGVDISDGLSCPETITRTWTVTDNCGNTATVQRIITVHDLTAPVLAAAPGPLTVECAGDVPAMIDLGYTDNCDSPGTVTGVDVSDGLSCPETITRTWTITDACGNTSTVTQTITVDDTTPPTASNLPPLSVAGIGAVPPSNILDVFDEADNCTVNPTVAFVGDVSDGGNCPEIITRTYSVTDDCGNSINVTQIITIGDPIAPTASNPAPVNVECIGDVPAVDPLVVTDEADNGAIPTVTWEDDTSDGLSCPETITRRYRVTDDCGNFIFVSQTITVNDITPPTASAPANVNVECIGDVPAANILDINDEADNCTAVPVVAHVGDVSDGLSCPETITRTYSITDDCGNQITVDQIITVNDVTPPTGTAPANVNVECIGDVPAFDPLAIINEADNCTANPVVAHVGDVSDGLSCPETITRTYSITDDCGNQITVDQIITVNDVTPPTASNPATTNQSGGPLPVVDITIVNDEADNCTANPAVAFVSEVSDNNPCPETITRIYSVTDDCGNTINVTHLIVISDPLPPTGTAPANVNVECIGDVPAADPLLITDEADNLGIPTVAYVGDVSDGLSCPETITRTYSITDDCGNVVFVDQLITVNDITPPTATAPANVNVECIGDVPAANILDITDEADNCTIAPVVAHVGDVSDGLSCPETITRTYSITDDCGNQITVDQIIVVDDVTPPTATAPANVNVECIGDVPLADVLLITNEADNCTANPVVAHVGDISDGLSCPETITRTYSITDDCGNQITVDQLIIVNDITPPTASNVITIHVPGAADVPVPDPTVVTTEADNCTANPVVAWVSDVSDGNVCNLEEITRTYSVTDDCGNQITVTQIIVIDAVPAPIDAGPDVTICEGDLITISATNPWGVPIVWNPVVPAGPFSPTQTTTYTVTADNLGCISTDDVTVTVEPVPVVNFSGDILSGCEPHQVNFTNNSAAPSGLIDCEWIINGDVINDCGNISYNFINGGTYDVTLTVTSATGCSATDTYVDYIYVEEAPLAAFTPSSNQLTSFSGEVTFTNNSVGAVDYSWDFGDNSSGSTQTNPSHAFPVDEAGSYIVELVAYSPLGCTDTAWATISVVEELIFYVPNSFTPDGDNFNEYFQAIFTSGYDPMDFELLIFNRWGEIVWESHDGSVGWDGTYGAGQKLVQDGTYTWRIEFKTITNDERVRVTGHVNVIR